MYIFLDFHHHETENLFIVKIPNVLPCPSSTEPKAEKTLHPVKGIIMTRSFPLSGLLLEFGGLLVFWVLASVCSVRVAIAGTFVFILGDGARRYLHGRTFPRLWIISTTLAVLFGLIDLLSVTPFMIQYEAVLTNLIIAGSFAWGAFGSRSLIQELVEDHQGFAFPPERTELRAYFKALTLLWVAYFMVKAGVYFWLLTHFSLSHALALRSLIGTLSLGCMIGLSMQGKRLFLLCQRIGLFLPRYTASNQA